jgi:hypothetical protein
MMLHTMVGVINTILCIKEKITLVPLTPAEIVQADKERDASSNNVKSKNQQVANSIFPPKKEKPPPNSKAERIKLKGGSYACNKM